MATASSGSERSPRLLNQHLVLGLPDPDALRFALAYRTNERDRASVEGREHERLEFLGDAVVDLIVGEYLYATFPDVAEGQLTRLRAALVCAPTLASWARRLDIEPWLGLAPAESNEPGSRNMERLLSSIFEAIVAVIYLQCGLSSTRSFLLPHLSASTPGLVDHHHSPKNQLQELTQKKGGPAPAYRVVTVSGPDNARMYTVEVAVAERVLATGTGRSKQVAEKAAATEALSALASISVPTKRRSRAAKGK